MFSSLLSQSLSKTQSPLSPVIFYAAEYLMIRLALGISSCLTQTQLHIMLIGCLSGYYFVSLKFQFVLPPSSMSSPYSSKSYTFLVFCLSFINRCFLIPSLSTPIPTTVSSTYSNLLLELLLSYTAYQIISTILAKSCN